MSSSSLAVYAINQMIKWWCIHMDIERANVYRRPLDTLFDIGCPNNLFLRICNDSRASGKFVCTCHCSYMAVCRTHHLTDPANVDRRNEEIKLKQINRIWMRCRCLPFTFNASIHSRRDKYRYSDLHPNAHWHAPLSMRQPCCAWSNSHACATLYSIRPVKKTKKKRKKNRNEKWNGGDAERFISFLQINHLIKCEWQSKALSSFYNKFDLINSSPMYMHIQKRSVRCSQISDPMMITYSQWILSSNKRKKNMKSGIMRFNLIANSFKCNCSNADIEWSTLNERLQLVIKSN